MSNFQKTVSVDLPATTVPGAQISIPAYSLTIPDRTVDDPAFSIPVGANFRDDAVPVGQTLTLDCNYDPETIFFFTLSVGLVVNFDKLKPGQRAFLLTKQNVGGTATGAFWDSRIQWQNKIPGSFTTGVGAANPVYDLTEVLAVQEVVTGSGLLLGRQVKNFTK